MRLVTGDDVLRPLAVRIAAFHRDDIDVRRRHLLQRESVRQLEPAVDCEIALDGGEVDVVEGAFIPLWVSGEVYEPLHNHRVVESAVA